MSWIDEMKMFRRLLSIAPSGDRIEFGVLHGATLTLMCAHPGKTYGVDSFEGMAEPTEFDLFPDGRNQYPKGRLAVSMADAAAHTCDLDQGLCARCLGEVPRWSVCVC